VRMEVFARTRFVGFHQWKDAPPCFSYLGTPHRHEFHVEVTARVTKSNREVEFQDLKAKLNYLLERDFHMHMQRSSTMKPPPITLSCEDIARHLAEQLTKDFGFKISRVEVSEDGECGGRVIL
jgi:6-pyruvoyl-tetrahydropterin synthase